MIDAKNNTTTIGYDALGRKTSMNDPDMGAWSYSYDVNGTLHSQTDARTIVTTFGYDVLDRLTSKSYSNGDGNRTYTYDAAAGGVGKGQRTSMCVLSGSTCSLANSWVYDGRGRQTSASQTIGGTTLTMGMSYDSADRMLTQTYPGGEVVTTGYDVAGRALSLCSSLGGCYVDNSATTSVYNELDQPVTRKLGNGLTTSWTYTSPLSQLDRLTTPGVFDRKYSYDPVGNVRAIRNYTDNQTLNYSYDHRDRLTRAWTVVGTAQSPAAPFQQSTAYCSREAAKGSRDGTSPAGSRGCSQDRPSAQASQQKVLEQALVRDLGAALGAEESVKIAGAYARPAAPAPQAQSTTTLVQDTFTRTISNGWGTATTGGSYSTPSQYVSDYSVNGSVGRMRIASASTSRELMLSGAGSRMGQDVDMTVRIATDKLPATGGEMRFLLLARRVDGNNDYQGSLRILPAGTIRLEVRRSLHGTETTLGSSVTISGLTASANSYLRVRLQVTGTSPTTIKMRVWADTATEPTTWSVTQTDSSAILQQAGAVGLRTQLTTGATNAPVTGSWDDWLATVPSNDPDQTNATLPVYDESYGYDTLGNLTSKAGVSQSYGANGNGTGAGPHQARSVGATSYSYDSNGNLLSGGGRTLTWNAENQPTQIVSSGITESYAYDADGSRVTRASGPSGGPSITTRYAFGVYEVDGAITRKYYTLAGQVVALRDSSLGLRYLYGDHLGSISVSTNSVGQRQGVQYFDAWGKRLSGSVSATDRSYTGQYLDDTGLLFYNARYYDPGIGRFVSADSIAPKREMPQTRNRYSYVTNNPLKYTDPSGHCGKSTDNEAETKLCEQYRNDLRDYWVYVDDYDQGLWASHELRSLLQAIQDMTNALFGGSSTNFRSHMGTVGLLRSSEGSGAGISGSQTADGITRPGFLKYTSVITFYSGAFHGSDAAVKRLIVHEFGHAWDIRSFGMRSQGLVATTGSSYELYTNKYLPGGKTTQYAKDHGHLEDWAESVAETVYNPPSKNGGASGIDATREQYVRRHAQ